MKHLLLAVLASVAVTGCATTGQAETDKVMAAVSTFEEGKTTKADVKKEFGEGDVGIVGDQTVLSYNNITNDMVGMYGRGVVASAATSAGMSTLVSSGLAAVPGAGYAIGAAQSLFTAGGAKVKYGCQFMFDKKELLTSKVCSSIKI